jgi:NADPH-dependent ferric siderophore reductase
MGPMNGTDPSPTPAPAPTRPGHRTLRVLRTALVTPRMTRVTLGGDELAGFPGDGPDQRIKLFFPVPGQARPAMPRASSGGPVWPPGEPRPVIRSYTVRRFDAAGGELDVDFVLHGAHGPAAAWAAAAVPGDWVGVSDPGGRWRPDPEARAHLVIGDESALPAIATVLKALAEPAPTGAGAGPARRPAPAPVGTAAEPATRPAPHVVVEVFVEVADAAEEQPLPTGPATRVRWLHRGERAPGRPLVEAVTSAAPPGVPPAGCQAWLSAEAAAVRDIRAHLIDERGLARRMVYATGYWRAR